MKKMTIAEWCQKVSTNNDGMRCRKVACGECPFYHTGMVNRSCGDGTKFNGDFDDGCRGSSQYLYAKYRVASKLDLI